MSICDRSEKDIQIALYVNVQQDCTSGPLPSIRLVRPPAHGKITVKKASVNATNYKQCLALQVPGFVAFYHSAPGYVGTDNVTLEVKFRPAEPKFRWQSNWSAGPCDGKRFGCGGGKQ
jgi:hypothetical protein